MRKREDGFTLIEILVTIAIMSIVMMVGAGALRQYWLSRAVNDGADSLQSQMRAAQERAVSESHPIVYGIRVDPGTSDWWVVRYDPVNAGTADDTCTTQQTHKFSTGVVIQSASFTGDTYVADFCRSKLGAPGDNQFALFYPRGNATGGTVTLRQPTVGRERTVNVAAVTGRVTQP
jgi:prepilin-type N-terminal cleavage/methylation domain-containing protein